MSRAPGEVGCDREADTRLVVRALSGRATRGVVSLGGLAFACAIGRGGRRATKREGDGASPIGRFRLGAVYVRVDRLAAPRAAFGRGVLPLRRDHGWSETPGDRNYNRPVRHPYRASAERMWREDHLYDVVVVIEYNTRPRIQGRGSAIFMHLARAGYTPTAGCIALSRRDMRIVLGKLGRRGEVVI